MAKRQHELESLRDEISAEIDGDAEVLSKELFGDVATPDQERVSDPEALAYIHSLYLSGDRQTLLDEARRDPEQFLDISGKLGVIMGAPPLAA